MKHWIVTRYNLGLYDSAPDPGAWLRHRAELFGEFTIPSVMAQRSASPFRWLLFIDERTSQTDLALIPSGPYERIRCGVRWAHALPDAAPFLRRFIASRVEPGEILVTQRLDNDDAIGESLVADVQRAAERAELLPCVLDPEEGSVYRRSGDEAIVQPYTDPMNNFIAFVERMPAAGEPITVWGAAHRDMERYGPRVVVPTDGPAWRQVWHDRNLWNGGEVSTARFEASVRRGPGGNAADDAG